MAGKVKELGAAGRRVAANVRRLRVDKSLTTAALSRRLAALGNPIIDTSITKIERGVRKVDVDDLVALAAALEVAPELLLSSDFTLVPVPSDGGRDDCDDDGRSGR